ncbi:hypothetical protein HPB52_005066 [Rhipicephalus sanguineus]|uniref:Uncharacterized protein n=1 Tax=Rhipicephalus sanguineus TaxID=34632 RepID=A0A9D4Q4U5_RHISA|nr:hypothetical protein HPB52_005066 [Rhipicephalus sanguineus]
MCKILQAEWNRQARFYKNCLFLRVHGCQSPPAVSKAWRNYSSLANSATEVLWMQTLSQLRALTPKKPPPPRRNPVRTLGEVILPQAVQDVLGRGPKFAVEPRKSRAELLGIHHRQPSACWVFARLARLALLVSDIFLDGAPP